MDMKALMAEFEARGGEVNRVPEGNRAIEDDRTIYRAMRNGTRAPADSVARDRAAEAKAEQQAEAFRAAKYDGWSDANALDYAQNAK